MPTLPDGVAAAVSQNVRERVDEIIIRRPPPDSVPDAPVVIKVVTVMRDDVPGERRAYRLNDADRDALWSSVATLTFKNWVMNQIVPKATV